MRRIVLCHLETACGLPALQEVFAAYGDRIGLVLSSRRFGGKEGGAIAQFVRGVRRSGLRLTVWLGFDIIAAQLRSAAMRPGSLRQLARRHGARLIEVDDVNSASTLAAVRAYAPDVIVVMNFDQILRAPLIAAPRLGVVNIHPSLLPELRGPCPAFWALTEGRDATGASIHRIVDEQIDAGPVVAQEEIPIDRAESVAELTTRLFLAGARMLPEALQSLQGVDESPAAAPRHERATGEYRSFPTRAEVRSARRAGVRLVRFAHVLRLIGVPRAD